jgi:hypothetical protein
VTPVLEVALSDLLSVVFGFLIHPLNCTDVQTGSCESTTVRGKILALVRPRIIGTVLQVVYASEMTGPVGGVVGQVIIPGEIGSDVAVVRIGIIPC